MQNKNRKSNPGLAGRMVPANQQYAAPSAGHTLRPPSTSQKKQHRKTGRADKRLSLMFGIVNEFHTTAVMGVGKPLLQPNTF